MTHPAPSVTIAERVFFWTRLQLCLAVIFVAPTVLLGDVLQAKSPRSAIAPAGPYQVETLLEDWIDSNRRNRKVPMKIYIPRGTAKTNTANGGKATGSGSAFPVVLFSHGLGGSRLNYEYLGNFWASHGFVSVHMQHLGSDDNIWKDVPAARRMFALKRSLMNPMNAINRPLDVRFVIDTLEKKNADAKSKLRGKLDLKRLGMAGHSYGAMTTLAVGGQQFVSKRGKAFSVTDKRIVALIPMSAPAPRDPKTYAKSYETIKLPTLHMTGTLDDSPIADTSADQRRVPFDYSPGPRQGGRDQYLLTFIEGDHMIFAGRHIPGRAKTPKDKAARYYQRIQQTSLAFLNAYLNNDKKALAWLHGDGLDRALRGDAKVEKKVR